MISLDLINESVAFLREKLPIGAPIGIVLGSGLGNLANEIEGSTSVRYADIPNFPVSTVEGHAGRLIHGRLNGVEVLAMKGRFHFYEGYTMEQVVLPIRVMHFLGVKTLILSNASGAMNAGFRVGDIMVINDHINLFPTNPLIGKNNDRLGPRFVDMSEAYKRAFVSKLIEIGNRLGIKLHQGVYAGLTGPCFETPAEYRYLHIIGADTVGMSTVPECIAAKHFGMDVAGLSVITDLGVEGQVETVSHEEVQQAAQIAEPKLAAIVKEFLAEISH